MGGRVSLPKVDSKLVKVANWSELNDRVPAAALVANVDLVVTRYGDEVSVLFGRCLHRGALLSDGHVDGNNLICGVHGWDYRLDSGVSEYSNNEALHKFGAVINVAKDAVFVDELEVAAWTEIHPQPYQRDRYLGAYDDVHGVPEEDPNNYIRRLSREGLSKLGHHGVTSAMGVARNTLPQWNDLQIVTAQLARAPLLDDVDVATTFVIGPNARKPLELKIPLFVSDMSFGALSLEAKTALARGAEMAGTAICSGEGGMLPEEKAESTRYLYELASARFGWSLDKAAASQAFHFKAGQGAKTGTGGHLPANKVSAKIAAVRGIEQGTAAISPPTFSDLKTPADYIRVADQVREASGGIPIGFKLSAQHIEDDIDFALAASADYIILDGRGGATGAAPDIFKNNISVPTLAALARARHHLDAISRRDVTLIITGGLRTESDFVKAMALGADGVAIANSALQAIGCLAMRACNTNNCPVGIATQKESLRSRLIVQTSAEQLARFLDATTELMGVLARACGHHSLSDFATRDLTAWKREIADLTGVRFAGPG